jgi:hypothetical protein
MSIDFGEPQGRAFREGDGYSIAVRWRSERATLTEGELRGALAMAEAAGWRGVFLSCVDIGYGEESTGLRLCGWRTATEAEVARARCGSCAVNNREASGVVLAEFKRLEVLRASTDNQLVAEFLDRDMEELWYELTDEEMREAAAFLRASAERWRIKP